jgi:hypothetical protein
MILLITFAITDWAMSLDPHWYSTIYGFWFCISSALFAMAFNTFLVCRMRAARMAPYDIFVPPQLPRKPSDLLTRDQGNILLMMTMVWAYFAISQYLITWSGNLPEEVRYYVARNTGLLAWVSTIMALLLFFIPFLLLLSGKTKRFLGILAMTTAITMLGRVVEGAWNVIPMFHPLYAGLYAQLNGLQWLYYVAAFFGIGGLWMFGFAWNAARSPLIPASDLAASGLAIATTEGLQHAS